MRLKEFEYDVPEHLIAQEPLKKRDQARMMVMNRRTQRISHDVFANINHYLPKRAMFVVNDSKVIPARLLAKRTNTGGDVEIFLLNRHKDGLTYDVLMRPTKRLKVNEEIHFPKNGLIATILDKQCPKVKFNKKNISSYLEAHGHIPLPPYIRRKDRAIDRTYYQTVYAKENGSVAAPTAGLHFTDRLIDHLKDQNHEFQTVTLHINYATFKPVEEENVSNHKMHEETYSIKQRTWESIQKAKSNQKSIVAVGTTATRVIETIARTGKLTGRTRLFIYPGYRFKMTDILLTNFHTSKSSLLMLVYAFGSKELMQKAYQEAIKRKYRFFSYGDCMLII